MILKDVEKQLRKEQPLFMLSCASGVQLQATWIKEKLLVQLQPHKGFFPYATIAVSIIPNVFKHTLAG